MQQRGNLLFKTWRQTLLFDELSSIVQRTEFLEKLNNPITPKLSFSLNSDHIQLTRRWISQSQIPIPRSAWMDAYQALTNLHQQGIIHWDVRPSNLIWDGQQLWLIDWEPSVLQLRRDRVQLICSPDWMAPSDFGSIPTEKSDIIGLLSSYHHLRFGTVPSSNVRRCWEKQTYSEALDQIEQKSL